MPANQTAAARPTLADVKVCKSHCWNLGIPGFVAARTAGCSWLVLSSRCFPAVAAPKGVSLEHSRILGFFWHSSQGAVLSVAFSLICLVQWRWWRSFCADFGHPLSLVTVSQPCWTSASPCFQGCAGLQTADERMPLQDAALSSQSFYPLGAQINPSSHLLQSTVVTGHTHSLALALDNSVGSSHS